MNTGEFLADTKEQIRIAMEKSQIADYEDEQGNPVYKTVTKADAIEWVMELFDSVAYQFIQTNSNGNALYDIYGKLPPEKLPEYLNLMTEYSNKAYADYKFEHDEDVSDTFTVIDGGKKD